ncbi:hypothetical protein BJY01DRAFT_190849 [Aspergillus pseudoustus]|uniref:Uncharacterized protein n=1 Tax=Aspergillus pseudoustus TaxID=1810923 RepID=A0ABR4JVB9_9EURO
MARSIYLVEMFLKEHGVSPLADFMCAEPILQDTKTIRDKCNPLWVWIGFKLLKNRPRAAQKFRRALHNRFGLTETEWGAMQAYFTCYEAVGVAIQRREWLHYECHRLNKLQTTDGYNAADTSPASLAYRETFDELQRSHEEMAKRLDLLRKAARGFCYTPIGHAVYACHLKRNWHMHPWLTEQCQGAGGCCARRCGCCAKREVRGMGYWVGHCTPACRCCVKHNRLLRPIDLLEDGFEVRFRVRRARNDSYCRNALEAMVWQS